MAANIARTKFAEEIIALLRNRAYIFGGYLRDNIANVDFNDLDFYIPSFDNAGYRKNMQNSLATILEVLRTNGYKVEGGISSQLYCDGDEDVSMRKHSYNVTDNKTGQSSCVDFVIKDGCSRTHDHPFTSIDVNVNSLYIDPRTNELQSFGYVAEDVCQDIRDKKFVSASGVRYKRVMHMIQKGYTKYRKGLGEVIQEKLADQKDTSKNKEEDKMDKKAAEGESVNFAGMVKSNLGKAGYRVAATQMTKGVRSGILLAMKDKGMDSSEINTISKMLDTEMGLALLQTLLGFGLHYAPILESDPRKARLAEEFQIGGMAVAGNAIMAAAIQYLLPAMTAAMAALPPLTAEEQAKIRVHSDKPELEKLRAAVPVPDLQEQEQEKEEKTLAKRASL